MNLFKLFTRGGRMLYVRAANSVVAVSFAEQPTSDIVSCWFLTGLPGRGVTVHNAEGFLS